MGDATDLVMAIEFAFDAEVPEHEAEQMHTPGQLADWLFAVLRERAVPQADAPDIFAVTQKRVTDVLLQASPNFGEITRATKLEKALPQKLAVRHKVWEELDNSPYHLLPLEHHEFIDTTLGILLYSLPFGILIGLIQTVGKDSALFLWLLIGLFIVLLAIMAPLVRRIKLSARHPPLPTVGDLVDFIVAHNYWYLATQRGSWSEAEAWHVLQTLIAREGAIEIEEVTREAKFQELQMWD